MAIDIEQVLLAKAAMDAERYPSEEAAIYGGAALGAGLGALAGQPVHMLGNTINSGLDAVNPQRPMRKGTGGAPAQSLRAQPRGSSIGARLKPGPRMAGGLIGMILGGQLGPEIRQEMIDNSPAAELLAKFQSGTGTAADAYMLKEVLADTYSQMGIA